MAHEISHSFDELGNIYDAHGRLGDWWTAEDRAQYHAAAAKLVSQFDGYCPFADLCVNGKQVLTESIADQAGLLVAHDAYILSLKGQPDTVDRRTDRRTAIFSGVRPEMAESPDRSRTAPPDQNRHSSAREISKRLSAQHRCLVQSLRHRSRRQVIFEARRSRSDLVTPLRIAFVEWPEALSTDGSQWGELKRGSPRRCVRTSSSPTNCPLARGSRRALTSRPKRRISASVRMSAGLRRLSSSIFPPSFPRGRYGTGNG